MKNLNQSTAMCLPAIFKCLETASPGNRKWQLATELQGNFMERYGRVLDDLAALDQYLEAIATRESSALDRFFHTHGFPGMNVTIPSGGSAVASVFDLLVDWMIPGKKGSLRARGAWYTAVSMDRSEHACAYSLEEHSHPLFEISARDGWKVTLVETRRSIEPWRLPEIGKKVLQLSRTEINTDDIEKFEFPFVELSADVDISFIQGMSSGNFTIDQAIKKVKLRLDDKGGRVKSVAVVLMRSPKNENTYTITQPFLVIFHRDDLSFPAFVAHCHPDSWVSE